MLRAFAVAAALVLLFLAVPAQAEDYPGVKIDSVAKGQITFINKDGGQEKHPISPDLKIFNDKGEEQERITGMRFLARDNVVDIKTKRDKQAKKEVIVEIKFVSGKVAELPKTGKVVDLKPDPNFKGIVAESRTGDPVWQAYIGTAKVGDFTEYKSGKDHEPGRQEALEVGSDYVLLAKVDYFLGKRTELRIKQMLPKGVKAPSSPLKKGAEEITVGDKKVMCNKKGDAKSATWTSPDVPFDGVVKVESRNYNFILTDFGRGRE